MIDMVSVEEESVVEGEEEMATPALEHNYLRLRSEW